MYALVVQLQWNPNFSDYRRKSKYYLIIDKSRVKFECLTGKEKLGCVRIITCFEKTKGSRNRDSTVVI